VLGHRPGPHPPGPAHRDPAAHAGQPRAGIMAQSSSVNPRTEPPRPTRL
jgi:hypothetical protein